MDGLVTLDDWTEAPPEKPATLGRTFLLAAAALAAGMGIIWKFDTSRAVVLHGSLETKRHLVAAPWDAAIVTIAVSPGEKIDAGAPLLVIEDRQAADRVREQKLQIASRHVALEQSRAKAEIDLAWRCEQIDAELHQARLKTADLLKSQFQLQFDELAVSPESAAPDGRAAVTLTAAESGIKGLLKPDRLEAEQKIRQAMQREAVRNASEVYAAQIELCDGRIRELTALKEELRSKVERAAGVSHAEAELAEAEQRLISLEKQMEQHTLTSPVGGVVGLIRWQPGDEIATGETLLELLNESRPYVVTTVESEHLRYLAAGKDVEVQFPGGEKRTGVIRDVPPQTSSDNPGDYLFGRSGYVSVIVDPKGKLWPEVPIGAVVKVRLPK